jgi:hypothetical protein
MDAAGIASHFRRQRRRQDAGPRATSPTPGMVPIVPRAAFGTPSGPQRRSSYVDEKYSSAET